MSSFHYVKLTAWTKVSLDNTLLEQLYHWTKVPWTTVTLDNHPWTIVATPASSGLNKSNLSPTLYLLTRWT